MRNQIIINPFRYVHSINVHLLEVNKFVLIFLKIGNENFGISVISLSCPYLLTAYIIPLAVDKESLKLIDFFFSFLIMNNRLIYLFAPQQTARSFREISCKKSSRCFDSDQLVISMILIYFE